MDMPGSGIRASECAPCSLQVVCYFCSLAAETGFGPAVDIHAPFSPHESGTDELQIDPNFGMGESVEVVENLSAHAT